MKKRNSYFPYIIERIKIRKLRLNVMIDTQYTLIDSDIIVMMIALLILSFTERKIITSNRFIAQSYIGTVFGLIISIAMKLLINYYRGY